MKALIFWGDGKTGKTLLMERAVQELRRRGCRVGTIKHCPHLHPEREHGDSARMLRAGAGSVVILAAGVEVHYRSMPGREKDSAPDHAAGGPAGSGPEDPRAAGKQRAETLWLHAALGDLDQDYVLIEGFKSYPGPLPSMVFARSPERLEELRAGHTVACSGPAELEQAAGSLGLAFFPLTAGGGILADFIARHAAAPPRTRP